MLSMITLWKYLKQGKAKRVRAQQPETELELLFDIVDLEEENAKLRATAHR